MRLLKVLPRVALAIVAITSAAHAGTPEDIGMTFCNSRLQHDDASMRALFSPSLIKVIEEAEARNQTVAEASPGDKPPFGDGIPYQAFQDDAPGCAVGEVRELPGRVEVDVKYSFPDTPKADWTDRLKLLPQAGGLMIDDIIFANVANGTSEQGLRRMLFEAFDQ